MHSLNYLLSEGKTMDHSWMSLSRSSLGYKIALNEFLDDYFAKIAIGNQICCPCKKFQRHFCYSRDVIHDYLIVNGFVKGFKEWVCQREQSLFLGYIASTSYMLEDRDDGISTRDNIDGLLYDTFRNIVEGFNQ